MGQGRIERVQPNDHAAQGLLEQAQLHLASARTLSTTADLAMAFVAAYDAARKSPTAILLVQGLRARGGEGGHAVLVDVVRPQFPALRRELRRFDWLRTMRNDTEYPDTNTPPVTEQDVEDARAAAEVIHRIAGEFLSSRIPPTSARHGTPRPSPTTPTPTQSSHMTADSRLASALSVWVPTARHPAGHATTRLSAQRLGAD